MNFEKKEEKTTTFDEVTINKKSTRPSIRFSDDSKINFTNSQELNDQNYSSNAPNTTRNRRVNWDHQALDEQEKERKLNPKKRILEPKTPYLPFEDGDDEYLKKLNEINKIKPGLELFEEVAKKLLEKNHESQDFNDYVEVETIDENGNVIIERKNPNKSTTNKDFMKKRNMAYKNEFLKAKILQDQEKDEDDNSEDEQEKIMQETLKNTLYNKLYGKIDKIKK